MPRPSSGGRRRIGRRSRSSPSATRCGSSSAAELERSVAAAAAGLRRLGVGRGDRVVAVIPNIPEAVVAFLACASIGAIWSSCSPDFGTRSRDRPLRADLAQGPDRRRWLHVRRQALRPPRRDRGDPRRAALARTDRARPVPGRRRAALGRRAAVADLLAGPRAARFEPVPFDHPLWSSIPRARPGCPRRSSTATAASSSSTPRSSASTATSGPATGCSGSRRPAG